MRYYATGAGHTAQRRHPRRPAPFRHPREMGDLLGADRFAGARRDRTFDAVPHVGRAAADPVSEARAQRKMAVMHWGRRASASRRPGLLRAGLGCSNAAIGRGGHKRTSTPTHRTGARLSRMGRLSFERRNVRGLSGPAAICCRPSTPQARPGEPVDAAQRLCASRIHSNTIGAALARIGAPRSRFERIESAVSQWRGRGLLQAACRAIPSRGAVRATLDPWARFQNCRWG